MFWNRTLLASSVEEPALRERRMKFLAGLSPSHREGDVLYVHSEPRHHLRGFGVFPEDVFYQEKLIEIGTQFDRSCFTGNTGVPGVFVERGPGRWEFFAPEESVGGFRVTGRRVICNVGAVGYPRDGDWRACYVLFDGETIWFRRVEYDVEATIRKINSMWGNFFGDRLREGQVLVGPASELNRSGGEGGTPSLPAPLRR
jgi:diadenosine tetraphosphatase ApaH/serine/threonine PP2A family protein phosphatase